MTDRILVAGVGNIFLSDDAFGVEVANRLAGRDFPEGVKVADFGIRGVHLAYELLNGYEALILIDALPMGEAPGTVVALEPDGKPLAQDDDVLVIDAHTMNPDVVLATFDRLGGSLDRVVVVGCQPASLGEGIGLTSLVAGAVDGAAELCCQLVQEMLQSEGEVCKP